MLSAGKQTHPEEGVLGPGRVCQAPLCVGTGSGALLPKGLLCHRGYRGRPRMPGSAGHVDAPWATLHLPLHLPQGRREHTGGQTPRSTPTRQHALQVHWGARDIHVPRIQH